MRNYVIINGVNSLTIQGLAIKTLPPITKPIQRNLREEIDGRDGDIVTTLGYGAYDKTIEIGLFGTFDIDEVIAYFNQKGTITFSNEADKVYYFEALDQVDYAELLKFRTANVVLHCQPFKYPLNETPLVEEYEYVNGSGTNFTLNNTAEAIFNKIDLIGNTEQTQYTGKNLIGTNYITGVTINDTTTNDITIRGNWASTIVSNANLLNILEPSTTYTITYKYKVLERPSSFGTNNSVYILGLYDGGSGLTFFGETQKNTIALNTWETITKTFTTPASLTNYRIIAYDFKDANNTTTGAIELNELQIEKGSTATDFEPYTGGSPAPNPDFPEDVEVVSGDNTIRVESENLFGIKQWLDTLGATYTENSDGSITFTTISALYNTIYPIKPTDRCLLSYKITNGTGTNFRFLYVYEDGTTTQTTGSGSGTSEVSVSTSSSVVGLHGNVIGIKGNWATSGTFTIKDVMLEQYIEGTSPQAYEPYHGTNYSVNLGVENLINSVEYNKGVSSSGAFTSGTDYLGINDFVACKPNTTYTITFEHNNPAGNLYVGYKDANGDFISREGYQLVRTFTTPSNAYSMFFYLNKSGITFPTIGGYVQLEKGTKANSYTPYGTTPIELCKIGTFQDYIYKTDKWLLHKEIGKVVLNGSEYWSSATDTTNLFINSSTFNGKYLVQNGYSNNFKNIVNTDITNNFTANNNLADNQFTFRNGTKDRIYIKSSVASNSNDFKTWLSTHNTIVYYVLANPTNTEITDTTLISQLEELKNATSYEGQTNISQTNNDLPFILDLSALKENSDHLVIDNIGNIYSKPTLDLEGTGIVDIYLNDTQMFEVDLSEKNEIVIDTEKMEAYNPTDNTLANRQVTGDYSKFKLDSGENDLRFSGDLTKATITRYERWL